LFCIFYRYLLHVYIYLPAAWDTPYACLPAVLHKVLPPACYRLPCLPVPATFCLLYTVHHCHLLPAAGLSGTCLLLFLQVLRSCCRTCNATALLLPLCCLLLTCRDHLTAFLPRLRFHGCRALAPAFLPPYMEIYRYLPGLPCGTASGPAAASAACLPGCHRLGPPPPLPSTWVSGMRLGTTVGYTFIHHTLRYYGHLGLGLHAGAVRACRLRVVRSHRACYHMLLLVLLFTILTPPYRHRSTVSACPAT